MSADKRSVTTDALEPLGTIIGEGEKRDAIHLAVEPMTADERLRAELDAATARAEAAERSLAETRETQRVLHESIEYLKAASCSPAPTDVEGLARRIVKALDRLREHWDDEIIARARELDRTGEASCLTDGVFRARVEFVARVLAEASHPPTPPELPPAEKAEIERLYGEFRAAAPADVERDAVAMHVQDTTGAAARLREIDRRDPIPADVEGLVRRLKRLGPDWDYEGCEADCDTVWEAARVLAEWSQRRPAAKSCPRCGGNLIDMPDGMLGWLCVGCGERIDGGGQGPANGGGTDA